MSAPLTDPLQVLRGFTLLRTDRGNVIARDHRDGQDCVLAECHSPAVAQALYAALQPLTGGTDARNQQ